MKYVIIFLAVFLFRGVASAQIYINPDTTISRAGDIYIQNPSTHDVYYGVMRRDDGTWQAVYPDTLASREALSNQSQYLLDSNGLLHFWPPYTIKAHDSSTTLLWQRLFTARDKPDHTHSDIIAGSRVTDDTARTHGYGKVTLNRNDDVDFRASGTIKLESGFHVRPGAFFRAYQEPRWGSLVFNDDFDSTAISRDRWFVANANDPKLGAGIECVQDTNAIVDTDYEAVDTKVLHLILREDTNKCTRYEEYYSDEHPCSPETDTLIHNQFIFTSAAIRSCPWPNAAPDTPFTWAYQHMPYGKWEVREKLPHLAFHNNQWMLGSNLEMNMGENYPILPHNANPTLYHWYRYGPFKGKFDTTGGIVSFRGSADWCQSNVPNALFIDGFRYDVDTNGANRVVQSFQLRDHGGFPASLVSRQDSTEFYYSRAEDNKSDNLTWHVKQAPDSSWTILYAPFHVNSHGDTLKFWKWYQPTLITLTVDTGLHKVKKDLSCHWDHTLNTSSDTGWLRIDENPSDTLNQHRIVSSDLHTYTEQFTYHVKEGMGDGYPVPGYRIDTSAISEYCFDTTNLQNTPYRYHTFTMEFLPNEVRYLIDSNVVLRIPDHLTPPGNRAFDWVHQIGRQGMIMIPAEFDIDNQPGGNDPFGVQTTGDANCTVTMPYRERKYLEEHINDCKGCWPYHGQPAAHLLVDYVKFWDVPANVQVSDFKR